jgi:hypothetical protein
MKKYFYLLVLASMAFASCTKLPAVTPAASLQTTGPVPPAQTVQTISLTLQPSDYALISSGYPKTSLSFDNATDAATYLPQILTSKYPTAANTSTAIVTYTQSALYFKPAADSLYNDIYYQLTNADYLLLPKNTFTDFSLAQTLSWLPYKYTAPVANQLALIKFTPYPTTLTPAPPYSFLYFGGKWQTIYTVQPAQYSQAGVGSFDQFTTAMSESSIAGYFNFFLKNDITIMDTVKKNDIIFVSFDYYNSTTKIAYQRVKPLQFDGNNFVAPYTTTATIKLTKSNGSWGVAQSLPVISYTLTKTDMTNIANSGSLTGASSSVLSNLGQYFDFESAWTPAELDLAFISVLKTQYTAPVTNTNYAVVYPAYVSSGDVPTSYYFQWINNAWVAQQ